jgi:hypothetical protein
MQNRIIVTLLVCLIGRVATADVIVDQENIGSCCFGSSLDYPGDYMIQTFTVNNSGQLAGVGVQVSIWGATGDAPVTDDLHVTLMRTDSSGVPAIGEVLTSRVISRYDVPGWSDKVPMLDIDVSSIGLDVQAGDVLAIALSSNHTYSNYPRNYRDFVWHAMPWNPHPGGAFYRYIPAEYGPTPHLVSDRYEPPGNTRDMGFRVLINVPEPLSLATIVPLLAMLFQRRRRCC